MTLSPRIIALISVTAFIVTVVSTNFITTIWINLNISESPAYARASEQLACIRARSLERKTLNTAHKAALQLKDQECAARINATFEALMSAVIDTQRSMGSKDAESAQTPTARTFEIQSETPADPRTEPFSCVETRN